MKIFLLLTVIGMIEARKGFDEAFKVKEAS